MCEGGCLAGLVRRRRNPRSATYLARRNYIPPSSYVRCGISSLCSGLIPLHLRFALLILTMWARVRGELVGLTLGACTEFC